MCDGSIRIAAGFLASLLLLISLSALAAEDRSNGIIVWRLKAKTGVSEDDVDSISGFITAEVQRQSGRYVISEEDIKTVLEGEEKRQRCDSEASTCLAELSAAFGVPEAISGDIGRLGDYWMLNIRRINVRRAEVINRVGRRIKGDINALVEALPEAVAELFGRKVEAKIEKGTLSVKSDPSGAAVFLKGEDIGKTPLEKALPPGEHKIQIKLDGYEDEERSADIKPHKTTELKIELEKIRVPMSSYRIAAYSTLFGGAALAAFGGVGTWRMNSAWEEFNKGDKGAKDRHAMWRGLMISSYVVGGAAMATGVVLWIIDPGEEKEAEEKQAFNIGIAPVADGFSAGISGRW